MSTRTAIYAAIAAVSFVTAGLQAADASSDVPEAAVIGLGQPLVGDVTPSPSPAPARPDEAAAQR